MKHDKKNSKIIPFPNVKERLVHKGMSALKEKKYHEALQLFSEARNYDNEESDLYLGMAICFLEIGELEQAKGICEKMLKEGRGHYFTVLQVYMTILIQLRQYEKVQETLEVVLQENKLPPESAEQFYKLLEFSRKMTEAPDIEDMIEEPLEGQFQESLFNNTEEQVKLVHTLKDRNITKFIGLLKTILQNPSGHPVVKTMILQLLAESDYGEPVSVTKFGEMITIHPNKAVQPDMMPVLKNILNVLDDTLGNENPSLYQAVEELWRRHLYVLYPFQPKFSDDQLWAAALHKVGYEMHGIDIDKDELHILYSFHDHLLEEACATIKNIEEFSYL
ncbi:DNA damage checkpoint antagonist DdcA [Bacillus sp. CLL-7-23]|uniref:DNA damage checkpoint antagonist DdcA n=1 Tax=Bacillus changyiensis TaxID=3004103 RepID=A0ABT4X5X1_9BACI|nr:DNA damage checkpoint antagonist DdcA [Bacillus changyiensis]MDA7027580.1 DNA damage checkpoint antagonist DdcA [Bacillus changyiensis]